MTAKGFGTRWPHPDPTRLFFLILKLVSFKKLNGLGRDGKIPNPIPFIFDFYFKFFYIFFFIFIILKLIYFIKNKNIINFYKLFIKKKF